MPNPASLVTSPLIPSHPSCNHPVAIGHSGIPVDASARGLLEQLPKWMNCIPLAIQWVWLACIYRSATLPSAANPTITAGGLVGEGKREYFGQMGALALSATAPYCVIENQPGIDAAALRAVLDAAGLDFPLIAKPDLGLCGYGVRRVDTMKELLAYLRAFPISEQVVLQQYLSQEGEAGIFYARHPDTGHGELTGLALRYFPRVIGDGEHTLGQLIDADSRTHKLLESVQHECRHDMSRVPACGEMVRLSTVGSTRVGGLYCDGGHLITPALSAAVDAIARDMREFYCGRFDVRFNSTEELAAGRGFTIIEVNGAGSEAIQAWDPCTGIIAAYRIIFAKQRLLFDIGAANRRAGVKPIGLLMLGRLFMRQQRLIANYPPSN